MNREERERLKGRLPVFIPLKPYTAADVVMRGDMYMFLEANHAISGLLVTWHRFPEESLAECAARLMNTWFPR